MANEEHLAILRQGVKVWNRWRTDNPAVQPDLNDTLLFNLDLKKADLSGTNLKYTEFMFTNLRSANLRSAVLLGANLRNIDISGAQLTNAVLVGTELSGANLSNAVLIGACLNGAHLTYTNLVSADLRDAELINADIQRAELNDAGLGGANLTAANLTAATLRSVDLHDANLNDTDLTGADLTDSYLVGASLKRADLINADFNRTTISYTVFAGVDLSETKGLETIQHHGPSTIGIDTIYKSKGQIPEIFLRGCGVPEIFIEYMHALTAKPFEFYSCFISYSHADAAFAQRLHDTLQGKGVRCWLDEKDALLGVPITHNIESGIRLTDKFLLCCSKESLGSNWVNFEIDLALHRETELRQEAAGNPWRIIPLDLDGHLFNSDYSGEALRIRNRLAGDFTGWKTDSDKFDRQIARVMQAIRIEGGEK